jgi:CheY-like chemotaxis protein
MTRRKNENHALVDSDHANSGGKRSPCASIGMFGILMTRTPSVLIVDDQRESIALLLDYLKGLRLDVMVALGAADGLRKARAVAPDAILLDVMMPGMDGFTVCRRVKEDVRLVDTPVIFLSAFGDLAHKLEGFAAGGVDYIAKPFSSEEVLARLYVHMRLPVSGIKPAPPGDGPGLTGPGSDFIAAAIVEMQVDGARWPGLAELAHRVGTNERHLTELFRDRFDMTVYDYLLDIRLEQARWNLARTTLQIQLIAERAGYRNPSDFSRAFRRRFGVGPRDYRKAGSGDAVAADD